MPSDFWPYGLRPYGLLTIWSSGLLAIRPSDHPAIWPTGHPAFWSSRLLAIWSSGHPTIRSSDHPVIQPSGHPTIQLSGHPDFWPSNIRPYDHPVIRPSSHPTIRSSNHPVIFLAYLIVGYTNLIFLTSSLILHNILYICQKYLPFFLYFLLFLDNLYIFLESLTQPWRITVKPFEIF